MTPDEQHTLGLQIVVIVLLQLIESAFPYRQVPLTQLGQVTLEIDTFADHAIGNYVASVPELANDQVR